MKSEKFLKNLFLFPDSEQWLLDYLSDEDSIQPDSRTDENFFREASGIIGSGYRKRLYKVEIKPLEIRRYGVKLFGVSASWVNAIEYMGFHDCLIFLKENNVAATRVFSLIDVCHEPIIRVPTSKIVLVFSEEAPHKLSAMFVHFENEYPYGNYREVSIN